MSQGDDKTDSGWRVIGPNTSNGALHMWFFPTLEYAQGFAKLLCEDTGADVTVAKFVGRWRRAKPPVEFVSEQESLRGASPEEPGKPPEGTQ